VILTMKPRLQLFDFVDPHYRRAMDAQELLGIQLGLETADSLAQQVGPGPIMNADVVALSFDTVNVAGIEEKDASRGLDYEPFDIPGARLQLLEQGHDVLVASIELFLANLIPGPLPGGS